MGSLKTPPRLGRMLPLPPAPREGGPLDDGSGLSPGDLLEGRYQIEDRLGEGGVGYVYRARQLKLHRLVAVKLLQQDAIGEEALKPRFEREALTLAALSHPHIVSLNDYGMVRGQPFLVMELLEGLTLRELLDQGGALEPVRALQLTRQLLLALAYAHSMGIVHRDLKPANLLVQNLPCHEHLKVLDFGLVKLIPGSYLDSGVQLSRIGFTFGTPSYMSPEHASGAEVDGRADIYAVGVLLFEMLIGKKPFDGELQDVLRHHFQTPVPKLASLRPELAEHPVLATIVERAMAKDRAHRYADAAEMLLAIDDAAAELRGRPSGVAPVPVDHPSRARALGDNVQRASVEALRKTQEALRQGQRLSAPHVKRVGAAVRVGMRDAVQGTRTLSGRAWMSAKPRLRRALAGFLSLATQARSRLSAGAARLLAGKPAALLAAERELEAQAVSEPADANSISDAADANSISDSADANSAGDAADANSISDSADANSAGDAADATVADGSLGAHVMGLQRTLAMRPEERPADEVTLGPASDFAPTVALKSTPPGADDSRS